MIKPFGVRISFVRQESLMSNVLKFPQLSELDQLTSLNLEDNPALTKAQIDRLQKALPKCKIRSNPTK